MIPTGVPDLDFHYAGGLGFTGKFDDPITGLQYNDNRWYMPSIERWVTQDPTGLGPDGDPYRYCGNNPASEVDPSGLANYWNPLTWGIKNPSQGWGGFFNPFSDESMAALGGAAGGAVDGLAMDANAATFHQIDSLNDHVNTTVQQNGGAYGLANTSAHIGVYAGYAAAGAWAWAAAGLPTYSVGIGTGAAGGPTIIFGVGGGWGAGMGSATTMYTVPAVGTWIIGASSEATAGAWVFSGVPILFPAAAVSAPSALYCWTAAARALCRGLTGLP